jgi:hypothetical protein
MSFEGIKTTARGVPVVVRGFGAFKRLAAEYLCAEGIGQVTLEGEIRVRPEDWYPLDAFLRAFERIKQEVAPMVLKEAGQYVLEEAVLPATVTDILSNLKSLDAAYHLNHAKQGEPMLDLASGRMEEGIGHYLFKQDGPRAARIECDTPYPCEFDEGVCRGAALRFQPNASVTHDTRGCRSRGDAACTYFVRW